MHSRASFRFAALLAAIVLVAGGCIGPQDYVRNGFKVGPNYERPAASTEAHWIDAKDVRLVSEPTDLVEWWAVFHDPQLNRLIGCACQQNLTLREAGLRILEARAQLGIATGNLFPQTQNAVANYQKSVNSGANPQTYTVSGTFGGSLTPTGGPTQQVTFAGSGPLTLTPPATTEGLGFGTNIAWELDFWGRFRRAIAAAEDTVDAECAAYNGAMVTLLGDVAHNYVQLRTDQRRIALVKANVELQRKTLEVAEKRYREGQTNDLDVNQARSTLAQTEAQIPMLLVDLRAAENRLCILMGMPPTALEQQLGAAPIPQAPGTICAGIPCDLLRRRPDVCRAERVAAAQAEQIGIAETDYYPIFRINGDMGYSASGISDLFSGNAFYGAIGPSMQWNILQYGRIRSNVCLQDAKFKEYVTVYQRTVLQAAEETENGLTNFIQQQNREQKLQESVDSAQLAVKTVTRQYEEGGVDYTRVAQIEQNLVIQQDAQAAAEGQVSLALIDVYRALGGGWQSSCCPPPPGGEGSQPAAAPAASDTIGKSPPAGEKAAPPPIKKLAPEPPPEKLPSVDTEKPIPPPPPLPSIEELPKPPPDPVKVP